jgi:hypothetical protein
LEDTRPLNQDYEYSLEGGHFAESPRQEAVIRFVGASCTMVEHTGSARYRRSDLACQWLSNNHRRYQSNHLASFSRIWAFRGLALRVTATQRSALRCTRALKGDTIYKTHDLMHVLLELSTTFCITIVASQPTLTGSLLLHNH